MNAARPLTRALGPPWCRVVGATGLVVCQICVDSLAAAAGRSSSPQNTVEQANRSNAGLVRLSPKRSVGSGTAVNTAKAMFDDVVLRPDGTLGGCVLIGGGGPIYEAAAGGRVVLVRSGKIVAETAVEPNGTFRLQNLSGGVYQLIVQTPVGPSGRLCRVWAPHGAPPQAAVEMRIPADGRMIRGQSPLPVMSFSQALTIAGVVGGAIAGPVIYHNARLDNRVPHSP